MRWKEHFSEVLNKPEPPEPADIDNSVGEKLNIDTAPPTADEIRFALIISSMKNGKAPDIDHITAELLKADLETATKEILKITYIVWNEEQLPNDWRKGLIVKLAKF